MPFIDVLFLLYCLIAARLGRWKRLSGVLARFARKTLSLLVGLGLFKPLAMLFALVMPDIVVRPLAFLTAFFGPFLIAFHLRARLRAWIEQRVGMEANRRWGAVAAAGNALFNVIAVIVVVCLAPSGVVRSLLLRWSVLAKAVAWLIGDGENG